MLSEKNAALVMLVCIVFDNNLPLQIQHTLNARKKPLSDADRAFKVAGAEGWNKLSLDLKKSPSVESF